MTRRRQDAALSLFAFQDIITGVAGVMIFILMLLVVQLMIRTAQAKVDSPATFRSSVPAASPEDLQRLDRLKQELASLQQQSSASLQASSPDLDEELAAARRRLADLVASTQASRKTSSELRTRSREINAAIDSQQREVDALTSEIEALQDEQSRWQSGRMVAFTAAEPENQGLWMVDIRRTSAQIFDIRKPKAASRITFAGEADVSDIVAKIASQLRTQTNSRSLVVLLRPSSARRGTELLLTLQRQGFRVALELLDAETQVAN